MPAKKRKTASAASQVFSQSQPTTKTKKQPRKYKNKCHTVSIPRSVIGFPENLVCSLRYVVPVTFDARVSDGRCQSTSLRVNSIHDPTADIGGTQPWGSDVLREIYDRYYVLDASVAVEFQPYQPGSLKLLRAGLMLDDNVLDSNTNTPEEIKAQGQGLQAAIPPNDGKKLFLRWSSKEFMKGNYMAPNNQDTAPVDSDPTHVGYCNIWTCGIDGDAVTNSARIQAFITLTQRVRFSDRKITTES